MIKLIFTLTVLCIFTIGNVNAFLGESNGLNLYKNIEKGMTDLQLKNFEYEISGGGKNISDEVNKLLKYNNLPECIKPGLTIEDYINISYGNIGLLSKNIKTIPGCYDNEGIDIKNLTSIMSVIKDMSIVYNRKAQNKSDDIYKISRIGLYSDGDLNNSSFDLITDIEEIDKIIFSKEIPYIGEEIGKSDTILKQFLAGKTNRINPPLVTKDFLQNNTNINNNNNINGNNPNTNSGGATIDNTLVNIQPLKVNNANKFVCTANNKTSGFSLKTLNALNANNGTGNIQTINPTITEIPQNNPIPNNIGNGNTQNIGKSDSNKIKQGTKNTFSDFNTSGNWPCNTFFCIKIKYRTYSSKLLKGGNTFSIESYMNTTNAHFKKFSGRSLIQSKMTLNQFELGFNNFKLYEIFHIGVMVSTKAPPIIKDNRRKPGEYKNKLKDYYQGNDMDYDRQNDLELFFSKQKERKSVNDSAELPIIKVKERDSYIKSKQALVREQNKLLEKELDHKILSEDMNIFYEKFIPLEGFTNNIIDYVNSSSIIIKAMNDKPSN